MPSTVVQTVIECPFALVGAYSITVGGGAVSINTGTTWYRQALTRPSDTGAAHETPKSFLGTLAAALGAGWTVNIPTALGKASITRSGGTSSSIAWSTGTGAIIRDLLGFTGDLSFTSGQTIESTHVPAYRIVSECRARDNDGPPRVAGGAWSRSENGKVSGYGSGLYLVDRTFELQLHPRDAATATAISSVSTAALPNRTGGTRARLRQPTEQLPATSPTLPMSIHEFLHMSRGRALAGVFGWFETLRTGASLYFDEVYLDEKSLQAGNASLLRLQTDKWNALWTCSLGFSVTEHGVSL